METHIGKYLSEYEGKQESLQDLLSLYITQLACAGTGGSDRS